MTWLKSLSLRERIMLIAILPLAMLAVVYQFVWKPMSATNNDYVDQIASYRLIIDTVNLNEQTTKKSETAPTPAANTVPLATRITRSGEAAGITLRRIEPDGDGIRITLTDTSFSQLTLWLADMEQNFMVVATAIEIDRRPEPETVSARILLTNL